MGLITPTWSPGSKAEETGETKAILQTRKSRRIAVKGSEKRLFAEESRRVIDLVSDDVAKDVVDLTAADDGLVIDLTLDKTTPPLKLAYVDRPIHLWST
jgi:hypothetical protein